MNTQNKSSMALPQTVDYNLHIKPLFSDRCFACHGPDKNARKASLYLYDSVGAYSELVENEGHYAIVPGNTENSEVINRIFSEDMEQVMPPPESNLSLNEYEKNLIKKWIDQGAKYKPHWSTIPVSTVEPPSVSSDWPSNTIDNFILAKMQSKGLSPEPMADKETLIRRVTLDLTGLPPSVEDVEAFLSDTSDSAYEKVVDRLLRSTENAEHLTSKWLDVARYADSHGYQVDFYRSMWPWREWVIESFKQNQPYDEFITWQLAGDLLPNPTYEQKLATGFNRNHSINQEGGIVQEEFRVEYVADRTNTLGSAILGLTLECARCHDHKYDPVSQKEYYQLYAFFNNVPEREWLGGKAPGPSVKYPDEKLDKYRSKFQEIENREKEKLKKRKEELYKLSQKDKGFAAWQENFTTNKVEKVPKHDRLYSFNEIDSNLYLYALNKDSNKKSRISPKTGKYAGGLFLDGPFHYKIKADNDFASKGPFSIAFWFYKSYYLSRSKVVSFLAKDGSLLHLESDFKSIRIRLQKSKDDAGATYLAAKTINDREWTPLALTFDDKTNMPKLYINGENVSLKPEKTDERYTFSGDIREIQIGRGGMAGSGIDELSFFNRYLNESEVSKLIKYNPLANLLKTDFDELTKEQKLLLFNHYLYHEDRDFKMALRNIEAIQYKYLDVPREGELKVMVMADMEDTSKTYILNRGAYDAPEEEVNPGTPESILPFDQSLPKNRLGLSRWLFDEKNPLTSRVAVNRFWYYIFGRGIVETVEDFGNQGASPSHPMLLDWLSIQFMESGWDVRKLLKSMVMSSTYRQRSECSDEKREKDPDNIYLSRSSRYRLPIEVIRDQALSASGLLNEKVGGPSVRPSQPKDLWRSVTAVGGGPLASYVPDITEDHYRRSLYTFWKRTVPPPVMVTFDASTRDRCEIKRSITNTPLQALVLLNDPQFMEASRAMAQSMLQKYSEKEAINHSFRKLLARYPNDHELKNLHNTYSYSYEIFKSQPERAWELINIGEHKIEDTINPSELAALTLTINTILNLDETITKE